MPVGLLFQDEGFWVWSFLCAFLSAFWFSELQLEPSINLSLRHSTVSLSNNPGISKLFLQISCKRSQSSQFCVVLVVASHLWHQNLLLLFSLLRHNVKHWQLKGQFYFSSLLLSMEDELQGRNDMQKTISDKMLLMFLWLGGRKRTEKLERNR